MHDLYSNCLCMGFSPWAEFLRESRNGLSATLSCEFSFFPLLIHVHSCWILPSQWAPDEHDAAVILYQIQSCHIQKQGSPEEAAHCLQQGHEQLEQVCLLHLLSIMSVLTHTTLPVSTNQPTGTRALIAWAGSDWSSPWSNEPTSQAQRAAHLRPWEAPATSSWPSVQLTCSHHRRLWTSYHGWALFLPPFFLFYRFTLMERPWTLSRCFHTSHVP